MTRKIGYWPCLGKAEYRLTEKRDNKFFMQSPGTRYLAMTGKLLHTVLRATISVNGRIGSMLYSKERRASKTSKICKISSMLAKYNTRKVCKYA